MAKWIKKNKDGIIVTLVFGALLEAGSCFFPDIVDILSSIGISFIDVTIDLFYRVVSCYSPLSQSYLPIQFFSMVLLSLTVGFTAATKMSKKKENRGKEKVAAEQNTPDKKADDNIEVKISKVQISSILVCFLFFLTAHITSVIPGMYYSTFDRDMTIIRPYIEEHEYYSLKSKWFLMKSKDEYDYIEKRINEVQEINGLKR